jgi:hypothetical protein
LKQKLQKAQDTMKFYADKRRAPHTFKAGDLVYVKLRPYRQSSLPAQRTHKLSQRFYGPFKLLRPIGPVAFELELPPDCKIHPVFHVSKLKLYHGSELPPLNLPPEAMENSPKIQPLSILDWKKGSDDSLQILVQWTGLYPEDATWESLEEMQKDYPHLHLEDKVCFEEGADVMTQDVEAESVDGIGPRRDGLNKRIINKPGWTKDFVLG